MGSCGSSSNRFCASAPAEERTELLAGAAGLAEPIFDPAHFGAEPDAEGSLAMLHGLFWLTANLADRHRFCSRWTTCTGAILPRCAGSLISCRGWKVCEYWSS